MHESQAEIDLKMELQVRVEMLERFFNDEQTLTIVH